MSVQRIQKNQDGITLLITLLLMGVLLGISASLLNITLKQFQFASIAKASEMAFQAASAGLECILYHDYQATSPFELGATHGQRTCFGVGSTHSVTGGNPIDSGDRQQHRFQWGNPVVCTEIDIYKFAGDDDVIVNGEPMRHKTDPNENLCPANSVCTVIQSRGYNVPCAQRLQGRAVEREITEVY